MSWVLISCLSVAVFIVTVLIFANIRRSKQEFEYDLVPNCLLTRWPLLFVSGPRSVFYFKKYWNQYPSYLAEHGYEVYNLQLPWRSRTQRQKAILRFLKAAQSQGRQYHFILDSWSLEDLSLLKSARASAANHDLFDAASNYLDCIKSLNTMGTVDENSLAAQNLSMPPLEFMDSDESFAFDSALYQLHLSLLQSKNAPPLAALGGKKDVQIQNARLLLERARLLAEKDLQELT